MHVEDLSAFGGSRHQAGRVKTRLRLFIPLGFSGGSRTKNYILR